MRHYKKGRKLGTDPSHTKAMKKSLVCALFTNDRIKTVEARAKEIRPDVIKSSPGQRRATSTLVVLPSLLSVTRNSYARYSRRLLRVSSLIARAAILAF